MSRAQAIDGVRIHHTRALALDGDGLFVLAGLHECEAYYRE